LRSGITWYDLNRKESLGLLDREGRREQKEICEHQHSAPPSPGPPDSLLTYTAIRPPECLDQGMFIFNMKGSITLGQFYSHAYVNSRETSTHGNRPNAFKIGDLNAPKPTYFKWGSV